VRRRRREPQNLGELSERDVFNVIRFVRHDYSIDDQRIYLMGHSMGGMGTLHLGAKYPELWAALAPMSPGITWEPDDLAQKLQPLPVLVVTGGQDWITPVEPVRRLVAAMRNVGMDIIYRELEGSGHGAPTYRADVMAEIFDFFDARRRAEPAPDISGPIISTPAKPASKPLVVQQHRGSRGGLPRLLQVLAFVSRRTLKLELFGWSIFYSVKHGFNTAAWTLCGRAVLCTL